MRLRATTKRAFQAATAIFIAELISWYFQLERGYWMTLTIIGGVVGTVLYFIVPTNNITVMVLLLVCVFFTVYMLQIFYLASVFFLTCFVVFLFALIGDWTMAILFDRILETLMGAVIALIVGSCFFSERTNVSDVFIGFWGKINASIGLVFEGKPCIKRPTSIQYLAAECQKIRKKALAIRYELLFHQMSQRDFYALLNQTTLCTQYVINLIDSWHWLAPYLSKQDQAGIAMAVKTTRYNIDALIQHFQNKKTTIMLPVTRVTELLNQAIAEDSARFASLDSEALGFFNLMYFFTRLNKCLHEINSTLSKAAI
jgi:hypothetical protein